MLPRVRATPEGTNCDCRQANGTSDGSGGDEGGLALAGSIRVQDIAPGSRWRIYTFGVRASSRSV